MGNIFKSIDWHKVDVIGDIHGCYIELIELLTKLGYRADVEKGKIIESPEGRILVFLGDFTDRGPEPVKVLKLAMDAVESGVALSVRGNHEMKLLDKFKKNSNVSK
jgi:protein phosphatase